MKKYIFPLRRFHVKKDYEANQHGLCVIPPGYPDYYLLKD